MRSGARQLRLPFPYEPGFAAADFMPAPSNEAALAWLERVRDWPEGRLLIWGEAGCGKTHLLHVWAERAGAILLPGAALGHRESPPSAALAIDDTELAEETTLFHLLNAARERRVPVLLAARQPPTRWTIGLPDLASRLRSVTAVEIAPPEDLLLRALLARLLAERQLAVPEGLQEWLLLRLPRTAAALREVVARLDSDGRRVDRALAASILTELGVPDDGGDGPAPVKPSCHLSPGSSPARRSL